jgi:hypothetical protein
MDISHSLPPSKDISGQNDSPGAEPVRIVALRIVVTDHGRSAHQPGYPNLLDWLRRSRRINS